MDRVARAFERRSGIPKIIGAIDGSHIRVPPPKRMQKSYFNRKSFYSIILSAVVDARGYFMSVDVGYPGRMSDSKVLRYATSRPSFILHPSLPLIFLFGIGTALSTNKPSLGSVVSVTIYTVTQRTRCAHGSSSVSANQLTRMKKHLTPKAQRLALSLNAHSGSSKVSGAASCTDLKHAMCSHGMILLSHAAVCII
jgi:DDE superfamily endonuclease